jgi:hypothetical protein
MQRSQALQRRVIRENAMRRAWVVVAAILAAPAQALAAEPMAFVYEGAGCDGRPLIPVFEKATGIRMDGVTEFLSAEGWSQMESAADWALGCWQPRGGKLSIALPLVVKGSNFAEVAGGAHDESFRNVARSLVAHGRADAFVRLGWEFNGNWYPWSANADPRGFVAAYRHVAAVLRATPGQHFRIVWNVSIGTGSVPLDTLYPGDDVVDLIGADIYNQGWQAGDDTNVEARWGHLRAGWFGLDKVRELALRHRKRIAIPEWGTGLRPDHHGWGDDPRFIHAMAQWMRANNVLFQGYWDYPAGDYDARMSTGGRFPQTLAAYRAEFGTKH